MVEVVRTNFAAIFLDFENFLGHSGTYRSNDFQIHVPFTGKGFSSPKKTLQTTSKSANKHRRNLLLK